MSDLIARTARLIPYTKRPKQVASFVTAYSYEPLPDEPGSDLGSLYVVLEVLISGRSSEEVADLIIETAGEQYYNQPHEANDPLGRFEAAIKAINHELGEHVNRGNASWIGKLSAVVAVQAGNELHLAQTGSAEAFLYRGKAATHVTTGSVARPTAPTKTFGSIATGQLEPGDRLLLATPALTHQIPLPRLQSIVGQSGPNAAIAEITNLLKGASTDRVAGLVIELTTPELAALQVRSEQPSEIKLGSPENALDAAKQVAAPIAISTIASSRKVASAAQAGWKRATPHARAVGLAAAGRTRELLSTKKGRRVALVIACAAAVLLVGIVWSGNSASAKNKTFTRYQAVYADFAHGQKLLDSGDKSGARTVFVGVQKAIADFASSQSTINDKLQHTALPEGEPRSLAGLQTLAADRIDQIDGLVKASPVTVVSLAKNTKPNHFQMTSDKAYIFDSGKNNALSIVTLSNGSVKQSLADTSRLGVVLDTTISGTNDGIYILTDKPSVWFYRFDTDSLSEQTIAFGSWPAATSISAYLSNVYLLTDSGVYKHVKNSTGFSPKVLALSTTDSQAKGSTALAVDGSIYLLSTSGLRSYLAGVLQATATVPGSLASTKKLHSTDNGNLIIGTDPKSNRIGLWSAKGTTLTFDKQITLNNVSKLYDANYSAATGTIYAIADDRLVRFPVQP